MPPKKVNAAAAPAALYVLRDTRTHEMGRGLFASTFIKAGTLILCERPIFRLPTDILTRHTAAQEAEVDAGHRQHLTPAEFTTITFLYHQREKAFTADSYFPTPFFSLVCGSGIPLSINHAAAGFGELGVFKELSRLNHACVPTCNFVWDAEQETASLYALVDIKASQQLTVSYVPDAQVDQEYLVDQFSFTCWCKNFCLRSLEFRNSYVKRLNKLELVYNEMLSAGANAERVLEKGYHVIKLMRSLGINDFRLAGIYRFLYDAMIERNWIGKAQFFAVHTFLAFERCEGRDGGEVERLIKDVNLVWEYGDAEGVDAEGHFLELVQNVKDERPEYLGFLEEGNGTEVFNEKTLKKKFEKLSWDRKMVVLAGEESVFVEEDEPVVDGEEEVPNSKKESHRAKAPSTRKKPTTATPQKKLTPMVVQKNLPPIPVFPWPAQD